MPTLKPIIYSKENIDELPWPKAYDNDARRKILQAFVTSGPERFIINANTTMKLVLIGDKVLPITICEAPNGSSYICSPYTHYVTYGQEEIQTLKNPLKRSLIGRFLKIFGRVLSYCQIDKNIFVNNWLMPTNLHPEFSVAELNALTKTLTSHYPDHAILFRSINAHYPTGLQENLNASKYSLVMSREVYFTDTLKDEPFKSRMFKSDQKILNNSPYQTVSEIQKLQGAIPRIKDLYYSLNIQKYSKCNPQYTHDFIQLAQETGWMTFKAFEKEGKIDGVLGYFSMENMMTSPFFGYDTSLPEELGLYRQIATQLLLDAKEKQVLLHQSGGAGHYKKLRRAKDFPEYTAVYHHHLGFKRKFGWKILEKLLNNFGQKFAGDSH